MRATARPPERFEKQTFVNVCHYELSKEGAELLKDKFVKVIKMFYKRSKKLSTFTDKCDMLNTTNDVLERLT